MIKYKRRRVKPGIGFFKRQTNKCGDFERIAEGGAVKVRIKKIQRNGVKAGKERLQSKITGRFFKEFNTQFRTCFENREERLFFAVNL
jgi:hypothetical protein